MPIPNLIHPVIARFEILNVTDTFYDPRARSPVRQAQRDDGLSPSTAEFIDIRCQISFYFAGAKLDYAEWLRQGIQDRTVGYVAVRYVDARKKGLLTLDSDGNFSSFKIKRGDRIVRLAKRPVSLFVTGFKDFAHHVGHGQTMIQVNFDDRRPAE